LGFLVIVVNAAIVFGLMYYHDFSELEVVGGISNHLYMLVNNLVAFPESHLGYFRFCSTFNFNIWSIFVIVVHAAIDFGLMYHHDYSELEVVGGISNHLCMLGDELVVFIVAFPFFSFFRAIWSTTNRYFRHSMQQAVSDFGVLYHHHIRLFLIAFPISNH
jgi:hypothetical protein